jgi:hypothetical protein
MTEVDSPLVFRGSPRRWLALLLAALLVSAGSVLRPDSSDLVLNRFYKGSGVFIGITALVILVLLLRRPPSLTLSNSGFRTAFGFSSRDYPWSEYYDFSVWTHGDISKIRFLRKGYDGDCTLDNVYDATTEEICGALNKWSARFGHGV